MKQLNRFSIKGDMVVWMIFLTLCMISIVEVYSASSRMTFQSGNFWRPVMQHGGFVMVGIFLAWFIHRIPCRFFKPSSFLLLIISYVLLVYVFFVGRINDAARWIKVGSITIQPSELTKLALIGFIAYVASAARTKDGSHISSMGTKTILAATGISILLIFSENWSTAFLIFIVAFLMLCYARASRRFLLRFTGICAGLVLAAGLIVISLTDKQLDGLRDNALLHRVPMLVDRMRADDKPADPKLYDITKDVQVTHAKIAIATSNIVGKGPGNSKQREFLPQAVSDFIYAIIIEEWGIEGAVIVMMLYLLLMWRALRIASKCKSRFPAYLVMGLALMIVVQAMMNMAVAVGAMPVTGQPLPLISRGGTSTFISCIYIGVILSVSWTAKKKDEFEEPALQLANADAETQATETNDENYESEAQ